MDEDDLPLRVVRASTTRAGTPKRDKPSAETWLKVKSHAPVDYPADYHAKLTSLPLVNAIKVPNWLETGLEAEGVQQLQEPDRVIAAAMGWTAEEYAQTKCIFFEQYATAMQPGMQRHTMEHWRNTLKFGGNKPKERAERLLAMWESLGWLREQHYNSTDASQDPRTPTNTTHHDEDLLMTDLSHNAGSFINTWSEEEIEAMIEIMEGISADSSLAKLDFRHQTAIASERLKAQHEYERTPKAINHQWHRQQSRRGAARKARSWTEREDKALIDILGGLEHTEVAKTKKRFDVCSQRLLADHNIVRTTAACSGRYQKLGRGQAHPPQVTTNNDHDLGEDNDRFAAESNDHDHSADKKGSLSWTLEEDRFMLASMKEFDADPALVPWSTEKKVAACIQRLKDGFGTDRTSNAVKVRYYRKLRREKEESAKVQEQAEVEAESEPKQDPTATGSFASLPQPSIAGKSLDAVINRKRESDADEDGEELQVSKPLSRAKRTRVTRTARSRLIEELFGDEE